MGGIALALYLAIGTTWLAANDWDPAAFAWFDSEGTAVTLHAEHVLDREVVRPDRFGHDGRWFWALAHDPLLLEGGDTSELLDRPAYRARRVLYPFVAAPATVIGEAALLWWMPLLNLLIVVGGTLAAGMLARRLRAPDVAALAFALNPAVLFAFLLDTADALAVGLVVVGLWAWTGRRRTGAVVAFAAAGLARELYLAVPFALAVVCVRRRHMRSAVVLVVPSALPALGWALYVRARLGGGSQVDEVVAPFTGFAAAWRETWAPLDYWHHFVVAVTLAGIATWVVARWGRRRADHLMAAALPFAVLYPFLAGEVIHLAQNATRAIGPVPTLMALSVLAGRVRPSAADASVRSP